MFHIFENGDFQDFEMFEKNIIINDPVFLGHGNDPDFFLKCPKML